MNDSRAFKKINAKFNSDFLLDVKGVIKVPELLQDNDIAGIIEDLELLTTSKSWTGWYVHPKSSENWIICKDDDGYLVFKPSGGQDAWGNGYTWREVKSNYGLDGVAYYKKRVSELGCR